MSLLEELRRWFFLRKNPRTNLGMVGDLDDVELLEDVERTFGINFADAEAEGICNVGAFFDLAEQKLRQQGETLEWSDFVRALEPHSTIKATKITRETEFFSHI